MFKKIGILTSLLVAIAFPAFATDNYIVVPNPTAIWDTTTASLYAIGTPGNTAKTVIPTIAGTNNFTGTFKINGTTENFPASGNLVGTSDTQSLSNKTLVNPVIVGPAPTACGATCTLTAANAGQTTLLNAASGSVATLPAATGTGNVYPFAVSLAVSSNKDAILAASSSDFIIGIAMGYHTTTTTGFSSPASTNHSIQMPFAGTQPSGGFAGDNFVCQDIGTNLWQCSGTYEGGTAPTTPFSSATS